MGNTKRLNKNLILGRLIIMNIIYLKKFIQYISILLIFALVSPVKADNHNVIKIGDLLKLEGKFANTKLVLIPKNRARQLIVDAIESIENKCCDENFPKKSEAIEIKNILQECLENKCQNFMVPLIFLILAGWSELD